MGTTMQLRFPASLLLLGLSLNGWALDTRQVDAQSRLRPSAEQVRLLRQHPGFTTEPFVIMNLLEFRGEVGREIYFGEYAAPALELISAAGGELVWAGAVQQALASGEANEWDYVVLVRWPSRKAFLEVAESPAYAPLAQARERGLARTTMLVMAEPSPPQP